MTKRLHAVYDGKVLRPEGPVDLELNGHYVLTIKPVKKFEDINIIEKDPAFNISSLSVKTGITDLATKHNHYLYGIPKQGTVDSK